MTTLLIITTGQTDVQLVIDNVRHELSKKCCGLLHDELKDRSFTIVDPPKDKQKDGQIDAFCDGKLSVCTPKLGAVLRFFSDSLPTHALIFDTRRETPSDPRLAGRVVEQRLKERGIQADCCTFRAGKERLEDRLLDDRSNEMDAVVRRDIVERLEIAISQTLDETKVNRIFIAATGGPPAVNDVIKELVRLHAVGRAQVTSLEVPDGSFGGDDDRAVEEKFHPAAGYRARWHALSLVVKGSLLAAWGAVSHLKGVPGQEWTTVIEWLSQFASSLPFEPPLPQSCDLAVLSHQRMAVRAAVRVELALCAGDIPRAVHGTVAFFETALWDHLTERTSRHPSGRKYTFHEPPPPALVREPDETKLAALSKNKRKENDNRPFILKDMANGTQWYWIDDKEVPATKLAEQYLKLDGLTKFAKAVDREIRDLRNDASHNEPTPALMKEARSRMQTAALWSNNDTFLSQPLVQAVLTELGEECPEQLCINLLSNVRDRLLAIS